MTEYKTRQPNLKSITTEDESQSSSTRLTLQQLNKETEKKETAAEAVRVRCRSCFKEIAPVRRCFGHGGGGGGDGSSSDNSSDEKEDLTSDNSLKQLKKLIEDTEEFIDDFELIEDDENAEILSNEESFNPKIIEDMIAKGLLLVDSDRQTRTLTIKLLCEPKSLTKEQSHELKKYMEAILREFNGFKEEKRLSDDCLQVTKDEKGNLISLRIIMPTLTLYDAFIQRLATNLVPTPSPKAQQAQDREKDQTSAPNSSKEPELSPSKEEVNNNEEQKIFNPSPFKKDIFGQ